MCTRSYDVSGVPRCQGELSPMCCGSCAVQACLTFDTDRQQHTHRQTAVHAVSHVGDTMCTCGMPNQHVSCMHTLATVQLVFSSQVFGILVRRGIPLGVLLLTQ